MKIKSQMLLLALCLLAGIGLAQTSVLESPVEMQVFQRGSKDRADVRIEGTVPAGTGLV